MVSIQGIDGFYYGATVGIISITSCSCARSPQPYSQKGEDVLTWHVIKEARSGVVNQYKSTIYCTSSRLDGPRPTKRLVVYNALHIRGRPHQDHLRA